MNGKKLIKKWWFWFIIILFVFILIVFIPLPFLHYQFASAVSSPCRYANYAWDWEKGDCDCMGIKVDTSSCYGCPDAGGSEGCIGIVKERRCYEWGKDTGEWIEVECS
jgi:hypothetical protein